MDQTNGQQPIQASPRADVFDRAIGSLTGLPGVMHTAPTTIRAAVPLTGEAQTFIVQTFRQRDAEDERGVAEYTVFVEHVDSRGTTRLVIPPNVSKVIDRQRDALTDRARSKSAKAVAEDRKARGIVPGFMRNRGKGKTAKRHK